MYGNDDAHTHYQAADLAIRTAAASPRQLVLMLFDGLLEELTRARGHIQARRYELKAQSINKCIDILNALTSALNYEQGGDVALRLASLYDYCVYRLYDASHHLEVEKIDEVESLLTTLQNGWQEMKA